MYDFEKMKSDIKAIVVQLSKKQQINLLLDLSNNLETLKTMAAISRNYKSDVLDDGEASALGLYCADLNNQMHLLSLKIEVLKENLK